MATFCAADVRGQDSTGLFGFSVSKAKDVIIQDMTKGVVSIIIPTRNRCKMLARAIDSCLTQEHSQVEVIVVDDGSDDGTEAYVKKLSAQSGGRVKYLRQDFLGACAARNLGMDHATGEFLQLLDSDDFLRKDKLSVQVNALRHSPAPVAVSDFVYYSEKENTEVLRVSNGGNLHEKLSRFDSILITSPLFRTETIKGRVYFNPAIARHQDIDFMFRCFLRFGSWVHTPETIAIYVGHEQKRISDEYFRGRPYRELFLSIYEDWSKRRDQIRAENYWMVSELASLFAPHLWPVDRELALRAWWLALSNPIFAKRGIRTTRAMVRKIAKALLLRVYKNTFAPR